MSASRELIIDTGKQRTAASQLKYPLGYSLNGEVLERLEKQQQQLATQIRKLKDQSDAAPVESTGSGKKVLAAVGLLLVAGIGADIAFANNLKQTGQPIPAAGMPSTPDKPISQPVQQQAHAPAMCEPPRDKVISQDIWDSTPHAKVTCASIHSGPTAQNAPAEQPPIPPTATVAPAETPHPVLGAVKPKPTVVFHPPTPTAAPVEQHPKKNIPITTESHAPSGTHVVIGPNQDQKDVPQRLNTSEVLTNQQKEQIALCGEKLPPANDDNDRPAVAANPNLDIMHAPSVSVREIRAAFVANNSPVIHQIYADGKDAATYFYDEAVCTRLPNGKVGVDPAVALGFFWHESNYGQNGVARITHSLANKRPLAGDTYTCGITGCFKIYPSWQDGINDGITLLKDYVKWGWGPTVWQVTWKWAPPDDKNDVFQQNKPVEYAQSVADTMDTLHQESITINK